MKPHKIKEKLKSGEKVIGTWNTVSSPLITEVIASSGLDFVIIDFEHGPFDIANLSQYTNACLNHNASPIVRMPSNQDWMFLQALDQGASGLICPHIESLEDSKLFTNSSKYSPKGNRGYSPYTKAGIFTHENTNHISDSINNAFNIAIIESELGLNNIEDICKDENLDAVYFGSYDISIALGVPADVKNQKVVDAISKAKDIASKASKYTGAFVAMSPEDVRWQQEQGFDIIIYGVDSYLLRKNYTDMLSSIKK